MELEEAKEIIENKLDMFINGLLDIYRQSEVKPFEKAIKTVLEALEDLKAVNAMQEYRINEMDIPVKKIKDKIKELEEKGRIKNQTLPYCGEYIYHKEITVLQELLKDK